MRILSFVAAAGMFAFTFANTAAQDREPGSLPEQTKPPMHGPAPVRPAVVPLNKPDPNSPAQAGRNALYKYLDDIADKDTAARSAVIAKITTQAQAEVRQQEVRAKLMELMGGGFEKTPLNAKVMGSTQLDGYRIEKILWASRSRSFM